MADENTPYIGENGNWYINGEDSGMRSQGEEGPQGPVGPQGLIGPKGKTGDRGPQGLKGDTGEEGPQGPKGEKGDKGDQGEVGPQGPKGDTGATGIQGPKGDTGATGPQGPIGATPALAANLATTVAGKALDATMGKVLDDKITNTNNNLSAGLNGCKVTYESGAFYASYGSVKKKLGEPLITDIVYTESYLDKWIVSGVYNIGTGFTNAFLVFKTLRTSLNDAVIKIEQEYNPLTGNISFSFWVEVNYSGSYSPVSCRGVSFFGIAY